MHLVFCYELLGDLLYLAKYRDGQLTGLSINHDIFFGNNQFITIDDYRRK